MTCWTHSRHRTIFVLLKVVCRDRCPGIKYNYPTTTAAIVQGILQQFLSSLLGLRFSVEKAQSFSPLVLFHARFCPWPSSWSSIWDPIENWALATKFWACSFCFWSINSAVFRQIPNYFTFGLFKALSAYFCFTLTCWLDINGATDLGFWWRMRWLVTSARSRSESVYFPGSIIFEREGCMGLKWVSTSLWKLF